MRFNNISMILGRRGSGKTEYVKGNPKLGLEGFIKMYLERDMKVLIIDTFDHPSWRDIPVMTLEDLPRWKKGVYRIWVPISEIPLLNKLLNDLPNLWNTCLIYEDAYKHTSETIDDYLSALMGDSKQKNIDIIFMYWSWMQAPAALYRMIDLIEAFKTKDSPEARRKALEQGGYYDVAMAVFERVRKHPSPFYHELIDTSL
jgi:hypothetical protein